MQIDEPAPLRQGEELDEAKLRAYLSAQLDTINPDIALTLKQFPGGHSNLTYLIEQGNTEYILRCPPRGSTVKSAHDMGREFRVL
jgi:aminoglycoside phosphotransferase (APT) family kinase protein